MGTLDGLGFRPLYTMGAFMESKENHNFFRVTSHIIRKSAFTTVSKDEKLEHGILPLLVYKDIELLGFKGNEEELLKDCVDFGSEKMKWVLMLHALTINMPREKEPKFAVLEMLNSPQDKGHSYASILKRMPGYFFLERDTQSVNMFLIRFLEKNPEICSNLSDFIDIENHEERRPLLICLLRGCGVLIKDAKGLACKWSKSIYERNDTLRLLASKKSTSFREALDLCSHITDNACKKDALRSLLKNVYDDKKISFEEWEHKDQTIRAKSCEWFGLAGTL